MAHADVNGAVRGLVERAVEPGQDEVAASGECERGVPSRVIVGQQNVVDLQRDGPGPANQGRILNVEGAVGADRIPRRVWLAARIYGEGYAFIASMTPVGYSPARIRFGCGRSSNVIESSASPAERDNGAAAAIGRAELTRNRSTH